MNNRRPVAEGRQPVAGRRRPTAAAPWLVLFGAAWILGVPSLLGSDLATADNSLKSTSPLSSRAVTWQRLTFEGRKAFISLRSTVTLTPATGSQGDLEPWLTRPDSSSKAVGSDQADLRLALETTVLGRRSTEAVRFRSSDGQAVQRYKRRFGSKAYSKTQRFLDNGVFQRRRSPAGSEEKKESQWSRSGDTHFPLPPGRCETVADPIELFYFVSASTLAKKGDRFSFCAFSKKSFARLSLEVVDEVEWKAGYQVSRNGGEPAGPATAPTRAMVARLAAQAVDPASEERAFEVMGLEEEIEILFDSKSRIPLEVRGRHSKLGRISIRLASAELADTP